MGIDFSEVFKGAVDVSKKVVAGVVIDQASKIPGVQKEIEKQKISAGKTILWSSFPIIFIGLLLLIGITRFK